MILIINLTCVITGISTFMFLLFKCLFIISLILLFSVFSILVKFLNLLWPLFLLLLVISGCLRTIYNIITIKALFTNRVIALFNFGVFILRTNIKFKLLFKSIRMTIYTLYIILRESLIQSIILLLHVIKEFFYFNC